MGCVNSKDRSSTTTTNTRQGTPRDAESADYVFKAIIVGQVGVGKTTLMLRYLNGTFVGNNAPTTVNSQQEKDVVIDGEKVRIKIFDTQGQERFQVITTGYFRGAHICLLCFDLTRKDSLEYVGSLRDKVLGVTLYKTQFVLVGCKLDLAASREVSEEEGRALAAKLGIDYFETSSKDGTNVEIAFENVCSKALKYERESRK